MLLGGLLLRWLLLLILLLRRLVLILKRLRNLRILMLNGFHHRRLGRELRGTTWARLAKACRRSGRAGIDLTSCLATHQMVDGVPTRGLLRLRGAMSTGCWQALVVPLFLRMW